MAKIIFNRTKFEESYPLNEKTEEMLSLFGTPLESKTNDELELEISANRPDLLSIDGFLRAFNAFMGKRTGLVSYTIKNTGEYQVKIDASVKGVRPYTLCAVVKNVKLDAEKLQELIQLQEKLHLTQGRNRKKAAIGIYPLESITFPITFKALRPEEITFTALDMEKPLSARAILQKHPKGKEYGKLIESFTHFPLFVDAKGTILSMPPIINSEEAGRVTEETKNLFVECSGHNKQTLQTILAILATTLADMGGTLYSVEILEGKEKERAPDLKPFKMPLSTESVKKIVGIELDEKRLKKLAEHMGYDYQKKSVLVPVWRSDVLHEVDVIEDIAIAYGYNNLVPEKSLGNTAGEASKESIIRATVREILIGLGLQEISSLHFITSEEVLKEGVPAIKVATAKTEYTHLRPTLLTPVLRTLGQNKGVEYPQKIFELGTVFTVQGEASEREHLSIGIIPGNFTTVKQVIENLLRMLGLRTDMKPHNEPHCIEGRVGKIYANEKEVGYCGELSPDKLNQHGLMLPVALAELDLTAIIELLN